MTLRLLLPAPHALVYIGLTDVAIAQAVSPPSEGTLITWAGIVLAAMGTWLAFRRDRRDQERRHEENKTAIANAASASTAQYMSLKGVVDDLHKELHRKGGLLDKEEANREARHGRRNDLTYYEMRFAHNEQWMQSAAECEELPLPPYSPLPPMPQRRRTDGDP